MTSTNLLSRRQILGGAASAAGALVACGGGTVPGPRAVARPNILVLLSDQHRWDWLGRNPDVPAPTPNMDALARRGVDFSGAIVPSPVCGPSRSCLGSGMEYENCGVEVNRQPYRPEITTFYRHLRDSGYHTMACGKIDLHKGASGRTLDGRRNMEPWGFSDMLITAGKGGGYFGAPAGPKEPYYAYLASLDPPQDRICAEDIARRSEPREENWWGMTDPCPLDDEHYLDNFTARTGLDLLDRAPEGRPWFLIVNFNGPHPPMDITRRMERGYRGPDRVIEGFPQPSGYSGPFASEQHLRIRQNYSAMVENIDGWLGTYQQRLAARGELEDTVVVYSSDHGEMLGDRGRWGKSVPFQASAGVPLIMAGPGIAQGARSSALVSLMDLAATCLDYGDLPVPAEMESRSLRSLLDRGRGEHREYARSALRTGAAAAGRFRMVQDRRYKLVEGFFGEKTLYDREADPLETENIAAGKPGEVARLGKLFAEG
ncbi:MAG: sulfatase-like hydrolase/transferase [Bryobacterales bacterium]|nr:sulfatase-like hydrolase/transferase [Bryobacterales bacterium]